MKPTSQVPGRTIGSQTAAIHAKDIMTTDVVWVSPSKTVQEVAQLMSENRISAVPVIDNRKLVGIVSEGDLIQREELGTATSLAGQKRRGANADYAKSHGLYASDVMTRSVTTVSEDAALADIAEIMQTERIRRVPVTRGAKLVGMVSRSDIVRSLATRPHAGHEPTDRDDDIIRFKVIEKLMDMPGTSPWLTTVSVSDGIVELRGAVEDEATLEPSRVAIERLANVVEVKDLRTILQPY